MTKQREKLHTQRVILVEGKYDAARVSGIVDGTILCTDGFGIYTDGARQKMLRQLARKNGLVILTDSDAAGFRIRNFVTNIVGEPYVLQAYVPAQKGKEKRKAQPGKEGLLGVEGISDDVLYDILEPLLAQDALPTQESAGESNQTSANEPDTQSITYTDLYTWGLSGTAGAAERKTALLQRLNLPPRLSKKAMVEVLNRLHTRQEIEDTLRILNETKD